MVAIGRPCPWRLGGIAATVVRESDVRDAQPLSDRLRHRHRGLRGAAFTDGPRDEQDGGEWTEEPREKEPRPCGSISLARITSFEEEFALALEYVFADLALPLGVRIDSNPEHYSTDKGKDAF